MSISEIVYTRRKELGMTQRELAEASGISKTHICDIEGGSNPSWCIALRLCKALNLEISIVRGAIKNRHNGR